MKKLLLFLFIASLTEYGRGQTVDACRNCLETNGKDVKEYIFGLFEQTDVVVLGERDHRDTTQYALILDLLSDPRFGERIGHVYTEIGGIDHGFEEELMRRIGIFLGEFAPDREFTREMAREEYAVFHCEPSVALFASPEEVRRQILDHTIRQTTDNQ